MKQEIDRELALHFIDKIHSNLTEVGQTINRVILLQTLLSFTIITFSIGIISVNPTFSLAGLILTIPSWLIFLGGSYLSGALFFYFLGLTTHEIHLRNIILRIYKDLGYLDESLGNLNLNPLEYPNIITVITDAHSFPSDFVGMVSSFSFNLVGSSLSLFLPIVAQVITGYKIILLFGWTWWVLLSLLLLLFLEIAYFIVWMRTP